MTRHSLLHQLFAHRAAQFPDAVAVVDGSLQVTYGELAEQAGGLSRFLRALGVGLGGRVGVCLPPGADLVRSVLAIWRAGAAVVPVDRDRPAPDSGVSVLLTHTGRVSAPDGIRLVCLDIAAVPTFADDAAEVEVTGADAAFVAGGPDGDALLVGHAALAEDVRWLVRQHELSAEDRVLHADQARPRDLGAALVAGATLVVASGGAEARAVVEHGVTVLPVTGELAGDLVGQADWPDCGSVRLVLSTGAALDAELCRELVRHNKAALWHAHGLAECGVAVTAQPFDPAQESDVLPLGRPLDHLRVLLLDEYGERVPAGVPGELHVAGLGVAPCYPDAPELTAERLVPDADGEPGWRLHRTGDLVRERNDGTLEHLGLVDPDAGLDLLSGPGLLLDSGRPAYVAPETPAELSVAEVWSELLEVDDVGLDDDFFQLGGYSLLLTQLTQRLHAATGRQVLLADLYTAVTVRAQAALVSAGADEVPPIGLAPRGDALPLSFGQRRLWFLDELHPRSVEWVLPLFLRLPADLSTDVVQLVLDALAARHESLRTRYLSRGGEPRQLVDPPGRTELRVLDGPADDAVFRAQFEAGFDLASGQVWRALLVREAGAEQLLFVTIHHIACDGWSSTVLEREFRQLCAGLLAGRAPELPALPVQYADYAAWQRQWRGKEKLGQELDFWRQELAGLPQLELPTDRPRPPERDPRGELVPFTIPAALASAVTALGQQHQATPFMTLLTAFGALLGRHSGQWDLGVGVPVAGRSRPELEHVVGFFLNSLVVRCRLDGDPAFADALDRVRETSLAAFAHQDVSFEHLVEELRPERDLSRTPLYQVAFNFNDDEVGGGLPDRVDGETFLHARQVAKTDLTLYVRREADGAWTGVFEYATALFERGTVERLASHFLALLEAVTGKPTAQLSTVDLLSADERTELLTAWNDTGRDWPSASVLDLFEAGVADHPDAVAVVAGGSRLTYRALDERANRIAHQLVAAGAGPDALVGVCLNRGLDLVPALLGVWKAGAAYVPLDPGNPAERLRHVLADSGAPVLVTESALADQVEGYQGGVVLLDRDAAAIAARPGTPPARTGDRDRLAYVIYTSGSTGTPKGVMVTQRGLANHLRWAAETLVTGDGGAPLFSSIAFDLPATNLYAPLITGRPVHVLPHDLDLGDLGRALAEAGPFSFVKLTPGHLDLLAHQLTDDQASGLAGLILVAGEALPARTANHWLDVLGPGRLVNEYGPTEASIGSTTHPVAGPHAATVPLGLPLPNTTAHVLDDAGRPAALGVAGELHLGGDGVARGYLDRPALTAERFVPDPYGTAGSRLYRTGDLARRRSDGAIEFLGRIDNQVKLRGYRIELGEIEARLGAEPEVRDAVVILREDNENAKSLVAYVVPAAGQTVDAGVLRDRLGAVLPDYMVPAAVQSIEAIPLTANGKLDHRALPSVDLSTAEHRPPSTPTEQRIAEIWGELLGVDGIGVEDSFFELGGHSILAIRMVSKLQDEFDIDLAIRAVFERPTISGLAQAVEEHIRAEIEALSDAELLLATESEA
ncbi:non-ribosomal peptide synthetase [Solihabitans fulvus]|uniref:non-ribosomal peptide synthetase n=1 Tax=Solihabitans fulvus TaxID=1892852 RepID=UPI001661CB27|nr:non-ribosomal peptide synthetase [Solihabitans fulvus]